MPNGRSRKKQGNEAPGFRNINENNRTVFNLLEFEVSEAAGQGAAYGDQKRHHFFLADSCHTSWSVRDAANPLGRACAVGSAGQSRSFTCGTGFLG